MTDRLTGKVALVTGGASGIGRASALAFAEAGARVVIADIAFEQGEETAELIRQAGGEAVFVRSDVSSASDVEALIDRVVTTFGRLDCAHNNSGIEGVRAALHEYPAAVWERVLAVNLSGIWICLQHEIRQMIRQGNGAIVNTSSVAGLIGSGSGICAYNASKHGVLGLTRTAALEYAGHGIRVNAVCPGFVTTPMADRLLGGDSQLAARFASAHPLGRFGTPREVAEAVVWLCSDAAAYITGQALPIDGGYTVQ